MNGKTVLILERLLDGRPHKLRDLAQRLEISVRLVRYEMQEVDAFLRREGFPALQYERPAGLRLMLTQAQHKALSKKLASLDTYDYAMTSAERRCVMTLMLIASGGEALTGQYFADQLGVSKSHLVRVFSAEMGVGPGQYLTGVRLDAAKALLARRDYPLEVVATLCGFSGANYLCKVFKKHTGQTPAAFRAQNAGAARGGAVNELESALYI